MADSSASFGSVPPYGVPIRQAIASGDATQMRQIRDGAQQWLRANPGHERQGEVHAALRELEEKLGGTR
jgi:hypothetical protein